MASQFHGSAVWKRTRRWWLAENPLCVMCQADGRLTAATVVDHIVPVQEAPDLALDPDNFQSLCKRHHDSTKQRQERSGINSGCDASGRPTDPHHPWNRAG